MLKKAIHHISLKNIMQVNSRLKSFICHTIIVSMCSLSIFFSFLFLFCLTKRTHYKQLPPCISSSTSTRTIQEYFSGLEFLNLFHNTTMKKIDLGNHREVAQPDCIKALIVEFITTFFFVFAGVGSAMATGKLSYTKFMFFVTIWSYQVSYWLCTIKSKSNYICI